jgi:hypothetical protein
VLEKEAPLSLISEYRKRLNLSDQSLIPPINSKCEINKEIQCFNKTKTNGMYFVFQI